MSLTPEVQQVSGKSRDEIIQSMDMQVRRDIDFMRAQHYWGKVLDGTPKEVLIEALSMALATGRYQITLKCRCQGCSQC
ncbi:hypothetical protein [Pseudomonas sp. ACM7]|uniref:hypothetical protein n=1 Tax=Pseudomonas sp. ACM7 TaxID=2052956 RepID=UPI0010101782|nr:hypothetical protein [Pseudomonas sp. ACM7]QAY92557.1 hypothetical protein CUN63_22785 [Pseudomonas sp. ACM7]